MPSIPEAHGNARSAPAHLLAFPRPMKIGVPKETMPGETRVGIVPETVGRLAKAANTVVVERGAGTASSFTDEAYEKAGAQLVDNAYDAELVVKVQRPTDEEIGKLRS